MCCPNTCIHLVVQVSDSMVNVSRACLNALCFAKNPKFTQYAEFNAMLQRSAAHQQHFATHSGMLVLQSSVLMSGQANHNNMFKHEQGRTYTTSVTSHRTAKLKVSDGYPHDSAFGICVQCGSGRHTVG